MKVWPALLLVASLQPLRPAPRDLVRLARPLQPAEIGAVLAASRQALAGKTFTLSFPGREEGPQVLMRDDGRPAIMRTTYGVSGGFVSVGSGGTGGSTTEWHDDFIEIADYTHAPAQRCDGSTVAGELVITYIYRRSTDTWTATAANTAVTWDGMPSEIAAPIFNVLSGTTVPVSDVTRKGADGRLARAFTVPVSLPVAASAVATQSLWIDTESMLPIRWDMAVGDRVGYEMVFNFQPLDLRPPEGVVEPPRCIP